MISENFLSAAVALRRKGLSLEQDLEQSDNRLKQTKEFLDDIEKKAKLFQADVEKKRKQLRKEERIEPIVRSKIAEFLTIL